MGEGKERLITVRSGKECREDEILFGSSAFVGYESDCSDDSTTQLQLR